MLINKSFHIINRIFVLALLIILFTVESPAAGDKGSDGKTGSEKKGVEKVRILVLDFASGIKTESTSYLSNIIRNEFSNHERFATYSIDAVENITIPEKIKNNENNFKDFAVRIGRSLRAHKVVTGKVSRDGKSIIIKIRIVDVLTGKIQQERSINAGKTEIDRELQSLAKTITSSILDERIEEKKDDAGEYSFNPEMSISTGVLKAHGDIADYLNLSLLNTIHFNFNIPHISWGKLELSGGFSRLNGKGIEEGSAQLYFVPLLASLSIRLTISSNPLVPAPVLLTGGGVTFISLKKEQYGTSISSRGYDATGLVGLGLYMKPFNTVFIQIDGRYHYLHERAAVSYLYGGIRIGAFF